MTQTNWEEEFDSKYQDWTDEVGECLIRKNYSDDPISKDLKFFLHSKIEEAERKVAEQIIEDIPDFLDRNVDYGYDAQYLKQQLKAKYLTPQKEK